MYLQLLLCCREYGREHFQNSLPSRFAKRQRTQHMSRTLRLVEDADVRAILEKVNLTCSCDVVTLKNDINELVTLATRPRRSTTKTIKIIDDILGALERVRNVFERHSRSEFLLPTTTLLDALRDLLASDLPVTTRSPKHPLLRGSEPTFGDQLAHLIDYYAARRTEWEALKRRKHRAAPAHDMIVLGLWVVF